MRYVILMLMCVAMAFGCVESEPTLDESAMAVESSGDESPTTEAAPNRCTTEGAWVCCYNPDTGKTTCWPMWFAPDDPAD